MTHASDILLVDDDPDLLKLISLRLTSAGYRVRTADSGETALAALAVQRPAAAADALEVLIAARPLPVPEEVPVAVR